YDDRFFFFFQAEDGIRDGHVTGVQTCALPISPEYHGDSRSEGKSEAQPPAAVVVVGIDGCTLGMQVRTHRRRRPPDGSSLPPLRSEERRVGKECRSRCSRRQQKKNR